MSPEQTLTDEQVREVLALTSEADSVELKLTIPQEIRFSAAQALGVDPLDGQLRQIFFFDTPDLQLDSAGVVVRARRTQGKPDDSVVKLRPVVPATSTRSCGRARTSASRSTRCRAGSSARPRSSTSTTSPGSVRSPWASRRSPRPSPSSSDSSTPSTPRTASSSTTSRSSGRSRSSRSSSRPKASIAASSASSGTTRTARRSPSSRPSASPARAFQVAAELRGLLAERGIDVGGEQQTKTRAALEYFSSQ